MPTDIYQYLQYLLLQLKDYMMEAHCWLWEESIKYYDSFAITNEAAMKYDIFLIQIDHIKPLRSKSSTPLW